MRPWEFVHQAVVNGALGDELPVSVAYFGEGRQTPEREQPMVSGFAGQPRRLGAILPHQAGNVRAGHLLPGWSGRTRKSHLEARLRLHGAHPARLHKALLH